jgi:hypothetical protein
LNNRLQVIASTLLCGEKTAPTLETRRLEAMLLHHALERLRFGLPMRYLDLLHIRYLPIDAG